ncbi:protein STRICTOSIDINE SYNTHASE-LIKE 10-like [Coffea eugenioides]|uniref:Protein STRICTOSIDINE SYNTHASE-LIKE 10-like n=1 Tax=Coffea arabica TaxID=13443 RepID=A0A6P6X894_COFAR|nr:protein STRICTOSIDINE SYNTHASE-LIKE 10-like [Coffea arabica]XP_027169195.1 protein STRICTOSIDINE SYNTHASE-LIKE 10-like [Coffea eugenioides]
MAISMAAFSNKGIAETILCFYVFVFCFLPTVFCAGYLQKLYSPVPGPGCFAFDLLGVGPYTGVARWKNSQKQMGKDSFSFTADPKICGRPLGLGFYYKTGELYTTDAGLGLAVIGSGGVRGKQLASCAEGVPFWLP